MAQDAKYRDRVVFLMVNVKGAEDAETYHKLQGLGGALLHGGARPPASYNLKLLPHKTIIGKDGKVLKNFDVQLPEDIDELL